MNIAVIGTGNFGSTLIKLFTKAGHRVTVANRSGADSIQKLVAETGVKLVPTEDIAHEADIVVLALPQKSVAELPKQIFAKAKAEVIVVDCTNYFSALYGKIPEIEKGMIESVWVEKQTGRGVVKAFNTILADSLVESARPEGSSNRIALPIFGDSSKKKEVIARLVDELGFDPVVLGPINESWKAQPGSPIYCTDLDREQMLIWATKVNRKTLTLNRDAAMASSMALPQTATWKDHLQCVRKVALEN